MVGSLGALGLFIPGERGWLCCSWGVRSCLYQPHPTPFLWSPGQGGTGSQALLVAVMVSRAPGPTLGFPYARTRQSLVVMNLQYACQSQLVSIIESFERFSITTLSHEESQPLSPTLALGFCKQLLLPPRTKRSPGG